MSTSTYTADVYISYAGNDATDDYTNSRDEIVKKIGNLLEQKNLHAREYKRDVHYKDGLEDYMEDIAYADFIILLVSEKYLKSEYCMYEAVELINHNKRGLKEKIFPVVLQDAQIFDTDKHIAYIDYWDKLSRELENKLQGKDPKKFMSLHNKGIRYREISENIDNFISELNDMCQLSKCILLEHNYQVVIDAIMNQLQQKQPAAASVTVLAAVPDQASPALFPQILTNTGTHDIAALSKSANDFINLVINKVDDTILDSEKAKKEFININFEEISGEGQILPATLNFIYTLRTEKTKYEPYRHSLIISALSLGLIRKYDETKARLLMDFATDDDPALSYRALTGVVLGLLDKENYISEDLQRKLETLQDNVKIQRCLLVIFFLIGNIDELHRIAATLQNLEYNKFEFFTVTQHWFQPFYENNPVLKENGADKKFAKGIFESIVFLGLDSTKYALMLSFSTLTKENIDQFSKFFELEKSYLGSIKTGLLKSKVLLEIEVTKYVLEFYVYAWVRKNNYLINLIEDKGDAGSSGLYKLVLHDTYKNLLTANRQFIRKEYSAASQTVKLVLEEQPGNTEALLLYGYSSYYEGNYTEVITAFEKVKAKGIKEILLLAMLGDAWFNTGDFEKAIENYELLGGLQENASALLNIGRCYELIPNPDKTKALQYYEKALELDPANYYCLLLMGDCYGKLSPPDFRQAFAYYDKAFAINSNDANLLKALTHCCINLPELDFDKAKTVYLKHIELEPQNPLPYIAMADRYQLREPHDYATAIQYYENAFGIDNSNIAVIKAYAYCIINLPGTDLEIAKKIFTRWIELEPADTQPYLYLGDHYASNEPPDKDTAFSWYYKAFEIDSNNIKLIVSLCDFIKDNNPAPFERAVTICDKYIELEPNNELAYNGMATLYYKQSPPDFEKCFYYFHKQSEIKYNEDLLLLLFFCAGKMENPDLAKIQLLYVKYKELEPGNAKAAIALAQFYEGKIKPSYDEATTCYLEALDAWPADKALLTAAGIFFQTRPLPDYEKSFFCMNELLKLEPENFSALFFLGWGHFTTGNFEQAKAYFEKCKPSGDDAKAVYQNLGHIAFIQHDLAKAKDLYKKSCALFENGEEFYKSSITDYIYLEKAGIKKHDFEAVLKEVTDKQDA